jgi:hypothetical protein
MFVDVDVFLLPALSARPAGYTIKPFNSENLELPVLRAMIYEAFLLNMCGAPS